MCLRSWRSRYRYSSPQGGDIEPGIGSEPEGDQDLELFDMDVECFLNYRVYQSSNATFLGAGDSVEIELWTDTRNVDDSEPLVDGTVTVNAVGTE